MIIHLALLCGGGLCFFLAQRRCGACPHIGVLGCAVRCISKAQNIALRVLRFLTRRNIHNGLLSQLTQKGCTALIRIDLRSGLQKRIALGKAFFRRRFGRIGHFRYRFGRCRNFRRRFRCNRLVHHRRFGRGFGLRLRLSDGRTFLLHSSAGNFFVLRRHGQNGHGAECQH